MRLKPFQRDHYARAALSDGLILAHEQGTGKSFAGFTIPFLWRSRRVLIAAPADLHTQLRETAANHFGIPLPTLRNMEDVRLHGIDKPAPPLRKGRLPRFYVIGYEALALNGADEWEPEIMGGKIILGHRERKRRIEQRELAKEHALSRLFGRKPDFSQFMRGVGTERDGITCVWKPSLARELKQLEGRGAGFDCIVLDEATAIQGDSKTSKGVTLLNPEKRLLMTGTPVKNRLESIFTLAWWASGGSPVPTSRWPYGPDGRETFARQHLEIDRYLTREEEKAARENRRPSSVRIIKSTARVCNVQRLWRLLAPVVLRCRKADCGEAIPEKTVRPIECPLGTAQAAVYKEHLDFRPTAPAGKPTSRVSQLSAIGMQLTNLRIAALCPDSPSLADVISNAHPARLRSWTPWTPKLAATLGLISDLLDNGEQVMVGSPFTHFNQTLLRLLHEASVEAILLDGNTSPETRGLLASTFKRGQASTLIASYEAMGRGHSFENCAHLIAVGYPWAYDAFAQYVDRIWRLTSPRPVTIYPMIATGSIDERMRDLFSDKSDTAQLMLDGKLFPETVDDIDPEMLLAAAFDTFKNSGAHTDEMTLEAAWPSMRKRLSWSQQRFREWHPPQVGPKVTAAELALAREGIAPDAFFDFALAKERLRQKLISRQTPPSP